MGTTNGDSIDGIVVLPGATAPRALRISVSLVDATMADAPAAVIAETTFEGKASATNEIAFRLGPIPRRPPNRRWLFDASATSDPAGQLRPGDYVLGSSVEWPGEYAPKPVRLMLQKVT
jgi:uncharacterized lipoprotein YbaY